MDSLTRQFVKEMEKRILTGYYVIGEKIPPLRNLAEEFHVSRSVINAGGVELSNNGYLVTIPRKHTVVADWKNTGNVALFNGLIENGLCDNKFFDDLIEGRKTIEIAIAEKASQFRTEEDLSRLFDVINREKSCVLTEERASLDGEFHHAVAVSAHNVFYTAILNSFGGVAQKLTKEFYDKGVDCDWVINTHEELYLAIKNKDAVGAMEKMRILLDHGEYELKNGSTT